MATTNMKITFTKAKETKNTWAYTEDGDPATHKVGSLYVKKAAVEKLGNPEALTVTIEVKK